MVQRGFSAPGGGGRGPAAVCKGRAGAPALRGARGSSSLLARGAREAAVPRMRCGRPTWHACPPAALLSPCTQASTSSGARPTCTITRACRRVAVGGGPPLWQGRKDQPSTRKSVHQPRPEHASRGGTEQLILLLQALGACPVCRLSPCLRHALPSGTALLNAQAGENTLNALCMRVVMRGVAANHG